ncbi:hypothetical protein [Variovorax rhizosphaerae]|uniref:DUF2845 domain-containing protein n=1 Tax=Variovorax rhizosphaerae TaxID=1836200 RepID=A0ABU8WRN9_9BURK
MKKGICLLVLPLLCSVSAAESTVQARTSAAAQLDFRIVVPPVFRVLGVKRLQAHDEYRVWTNMPSVAFNGVQYRFQHTGENVLRVPRTDRGEAWVVHGL